MKWTRALSFWRGDRHAIVLHPDGAEPRGFHGKNAFADQFNIVRGRADVIFDVGANTGQTTERYLELFDDATIYCFSPTGDSQETPPAGQRTSPTNTSAAGAISLQLASCASFLTNFWR